MTIEQKLERRQLKTKRWADTGDAYWDLVEKEDQDPRRMVWNVGKLNYEVISPWEVRDDFEAWEIE